MPFFHFRLLGNMKNFLFFLFILFTFFACKENEQNNLAENKNKKVEIVKQDSSNLHVFVAKIHACTPKDQLEIGESNRAEIQGEVIQSIYGKNTPKIIQFDVEGTLNIVELSRAKHALFFVLKSDSKPTFRLIPSHYMEVYPTADNQWACLYQTSDFEHPSASKSMIKPEKINFREAVIFDLDEDEINDFPSPYYTQKNNLVYADYGLLTHAYFKLKKQTTLKALGIF